MSVYPDVITGVAATLPFEHASFQAVLATEFENGIEVRRLVQDSTRRDVRINYSILSFADANLLRRFYEARKGSFESFMLFYPQVETYVNELVGVMETVVTAINLPSFGAQSRSLYIDPLVPLVEGVDWTFTQGGGPDGEDKADLLFTPDVGDIYRFDFTGRLKIRARFVENPMVLTDVKQYWSSLTVELKGLEAQL